MLGALTYQKNLFSSASSLPFMNIKRNRQKCHYCCPFLCMQLTETKHRVKYQVKFSPFLLWKVKQHQELWSLYGKKLSPTEVIAVGRNCNLFHFINQNHYFSQENKVVRSCKLFSQINLIAVSSFIKEVTSTTFILPWDKSLVPSVKNNLYVILHVTLCLAYINSDMFRVA